MSLWSFLRNCIGKDLTKIPMPVCMVCVGGVSVYGRYIVCGWVGLVCVFTAFTPLYPQSVTCTSSLPHTCIIYIYTHHLSPLLPPSPLPLLPLLLLPPSPLPLLPPSPLPLLPLLPPFTTPKVNFNEPLSMLQRMVEDFIYSDILVKAASCDTTLEELTYVAAFATSCYAANRVNKPFNPMLGETYECDQRAELGWRCFMEQVRGV